MKIGFVGLGKLGLPCAAALAARGHDVVGYDRVAKNPDEPILPYEKGLDGVSDFGEFLRNTTLRFGTMDEVARHSEIIFVAVQTPHLPEFEGTVPISHTRADFDYSHLAAAIGDLAGVVTKDTIVVIISTVLPGTIDNVVRPLVHEHIRLVYNPFFIAMGTTIQDFLNPEFVLLGAYDADALRTVEEFYEQLVDAPIHKTHIQNAELIKLLYNTYIGMKIAFANVVMELCDKSAMGDADDVVKCLGLANRRLISTKYMQGGMGDGGGCHPRDNIAMSWYARKLGLSFDWFENIMLARESQTAWLADVMQSYGLPLTILGYAYKENTPITTGSPALLLRNILVSRGADVSMYDPLVDDDDGHIPRDRPRVYLIGCRHDALRSYRFVPGSVVIDPWRYLGTVDADVVYRPLGIGHEASKRRAGDVGADATYQDAAEGA